MTQLAVIRLVTASWTELSVPSLSVIRLVPALVTALSVPSLSVTPLVAALVHALSETQLAVIRLGTGSLNASWEWGRCTVYPTFGGDPATYPSCQGRA